MRNIFKGVDAPMVVKLAILHVVIITVSNALVGIPLTVFGILMNWSAFTFPFVVLATDLTVRLLGKNIARSTIAAAYPLAIVSSIAIVLLTGAPLSVALRIGLASATAYAIGTLLDVYVFQMVRDKFTTNWWAAPALSTVASNIIDTYTFFAVAFKGSADAYMAANWVAIATSQVIIKIVVGAIVFLPLYGLLLMYLKRRLQDKSEG